MIKPTKKLSTLNFFLVYSFKLLLETVQRDIKQKRCLFCDDTTYNSEAICPPCNQDLPWNTFHCSLCALPMPAANATDNKQALTIACGECIATPPPFTSTVASFRYDTPINKSIQLFKYNRKQYFGTFLANCLVKTIVQKYQNAPLPSCIVPVPMHKDKLKERGFNQAQLISKKLSRALSIPSDSNILQKIRPTPPQTGLNKKQRTRNLKGAFHLTTSIAGQHIALVDDVVTTRATSDLLCQLLIDAGAKRVDVWCIARTEKYRS